MEKHGFKYIKHHLPRLVTDFQSLNHLEAESLALSAMAHEAALPYSIHLYFMKKDIHSKSDAQKRHHSMKHTSTKQGYCFQCGNVYLGICSNGIVVYEVSSPCTTHCNVLQVVVDNEINKSFLLLLQIGVNGFVESSTVFNWKDIVNVSVNVSILQQVHKDPRQGTYTLVCNNA